MMAGEILIRPCDTLAEFHRCVELQRAIWGEADLEVEPVTSFVMAARIGGQVLGAFDAGRMVGYTLALPGIRDGKIFLHSHMTGVLADYRGRGVGLQLKLFQRQDALSRGIRHVEWTFDPLEFRNAQFNLTRLGAVCRCYLPNLYGVTSSPLHRGLPTDRLLAEWHLDSQRVAGILEGKIAATGEAPAVIEVPAWLSAGEARTASELTEVQARLREEFQSWFGRGYAAIGTRAVPGAPAYLLAPWSGFQESSEKA
jgi:predicted GNAT superfamily acetyltransferase